MSSFGSADRTCRESSPVTRTLKHWSGIFLTSWNTSLTGLFTSLWSIFVIILPAMTPARSSWEVCGGVTQPTIRDAATIRIVPVFIGSPPCFYSWPIKVLLSRHFPVAENAWFRKFAAHSGDTSLLNSSSVRIFTSRLFALSSTSSLDLLRREHVARLFRHRSRRASAEAFE